MRRSRSRAALVALAAALGALLVQSPSAGAATKAKCASYSTVYKTSPTWSQAVLRGPEVWPLTQGRRARVAILSTGADERNAQLRGALDRGGDVLDSRRGALSDCDGRGTFLAGLVAARRADKDTTFAGVAPAATLIPIRVVETVTTYGGTTQQRGGDAAALADGIQLAMRRHATVICIPLQVATNTGPLRTAVAAAIAGGALVVTGGQLMSNQANGEQKPHAYPAEYPGVLVVDAVDDQGGVSRPTSYRVPGAEIAAPGTALVSTAAGPDARGLGHVGPRPGLDPSGATAIVAGVAALVQTYRPNLTVADLRSRLIATAEPLTARSRGSAPVRLVDAYAAVTSTIVTQRPGGYATRAVPQATPGDPWPSARQALIVALLLLGLTGVAVIGMLTVRSGRAQSGSTPRTEGASARP